MSNNAISPLWIISLPADSSNPDDQLAELDPVLAGKSRLGGGSRLANAKTLPYPPFKVRDTLLPLPFPGWCVRGDEEMRIGQREEV